MALPGLVTLSNPQNRVKDSYASSPKIDLTVRANGEEKIMVMDSQGHWTLAGFDKPTTAATVTTGGAGSFTANKYWVYSYVYVAKRNYPLVENAQTGNGSPAPRSNPAPNSTANSTVNTNVKILSIPTTQRSDISHIWIYRTLIDFTDAQEALDNALAGVMFWIGEVPNNANVASVTFTDNGTDTNGLEQIENDNFAAPIFDKVVYADPYFWGFGNSIWSNYVTITSTGLLTIYGALSPVPLKWYDGRNGQTISLSGITSGGYDNHGNFYFKVIDNQTAQLYSDIALTTPEGVAYTGTCIAYIRGANTTLYRSKPRNPFSWGYTDLIGDVQVPQLYAFSVGGGEGTALAIIANQNLLKLDTEKPTKCYTLNLKSAGTPNFESSLRIISDSFSVSHADTQFSAVLDKGQTVLRSLDMKSFSLVDCDGASQLSISGQVYRSLQASEYNYGLDEPYRKSDRGCGIYVSKFELNCLFLSSIPSTGLPHILYQHASTGYWGLIDIPDIICAEAVYDDFISCNRIFVGTSTGFVGELFTDRVWNNWFTAQTDGFVRINVGYGACTVTASNAITVLSTNPRFCSDTLGAVPLTGLIGNYLTVIYATGKLRGKITSISNTGLTLNCDALLRQTDGYADPSIALPPATPFAGTYYIGLIEMEIGRSFNGQIPFEYKKIEEFYTSWIYPGIYGVFPTEFPTIEFYGTFLPNYSGATHEVRMVPSNMSQGQFPVDGNFTTPTQIPVDLAKTFGIIIRDRNFCEAQLMSYEIRLNSLDGNNRQNNS